MDDLTDRLISAAAGDSVTVRELIDRGANVHGADEETGDRPLHRAAMEGNTDIARLLIEAGADVNARNALGQTPLHWAADKANIACLHFLIGNGAQVDGVDADGRRPSDWAESNGDSEIASSLRKLESMKNRRSQRSP
jgi:ankyrin repeat protein